VGSSTTGGAPLEPGRPDTCIVLTPQRELGMWQTEIISKQNRATRRNNPEDTILQNLQGSDEGRWHSELLGSWTLSIVPKAKYYEEWRLLGCYAVWLL
jgi:hypothetical protein